MEVELWNGAAKAIVDPLGAWLTNLSDENGDIIYPKRSLEAADGTTKDRGGLFACAPDFGPGGASGLPQHGFARTEPWEVVDRTESSVLLKLIPSEGEYKDVTFVVSYQLNDHILIATFDVANDSGHDVRVAPAFHPYFATHGGEVKINGEQQVLSELHEATFEQDEKQEIELAGRKLTLASPQLTTWAKWTDELGPYICLEPSLAGFSFLNETPAPAEVLKPGETKSFTFTITWRD
jgi:glucose-6-phosphate 1-epimerase